MKAMMLVTQGHRDSVREPGLSAWTRAVTGAAG